MNDIALLVNPGAGSGRGMSYAITAAEAMRREGSSVDVRIGQSAEHSASIARNTVEQGFSTLVACGGDGLVHLAVQATARSETALGIIPAGTGNDIARALALPLRNPVAAAATVLRNAQRTIDLGRVGDRWFASVLAMGFDSRVNDRANRLRRPHGKLRYHAAVALELPAFRPIPFRLTLDAHVIELDAMLVAVGNGPSYGGGMRICPAAALDDATFDITVVTDISSVKLLRLFPTVYSGRHIHRPEVLTFRASRVRVEAAGVSGYADGERIGVTPLIADVVRSALRVIA